MKLGDTVYWCKYTGINAYGAPTYNSPILIKLRLNHFTCQPLTEYNDIKQFGADASSTWKVMIPTNIYERLYNIGINDVFYVDGVKPSTANTYVNGDGANAIVDRPPTIVNRFARVYLTRRTEE